MKKGTIILIRDFIIAITHSLVSLLRILILTKPNLKLPKIKEEKELIILGNGPSLKNSLTLHEILTGKSLMCVNYFGRTDEYVKLKPEYYVLCSPEYFVKDEKKEFEIERTKTLEEIGLRTSWRMSLIVPALAKKSKMWPECLLQNPNIQIHYMNTTPIEGFPAFRHYLFSKNFGMPRPHNVLIPCIWLAINMGYEKTFLLGADHSWLPEISVTFNNDVLLSQKHFYDDQTKNQEVVVNKPVAKPMYKGASSEKRRLHEILEKFYISFKSYWILKEFANFQKVQIFNATDGSFIDAFDRVELKSLSN